MILAAVVGLALLANLSVALGGNKTHGFNGVPSFAPSGPAPGSLRKSNDSQCTGCCSNWGSRTKHETDQNLILAGTFNGSDCVCCKWQCSGGPPNEPNPGPGPKPYLVRNTYYG